MQPLAPPRPHRGADQVNGANAATLQLALESQIEIRRIDADEHGNMRIAETLRDVAAQADESRQVRYDLDEAAHGEVLGRRPRLAARRFHLRSGDAGKLDGGPLPAHRVDQR